MKRTAPTDPARTRQVIQAAIDVFLRYGYVRTTMADIAKSAGLSRPNLYLSFPDKESVFRAVIETMVTAKFEDIKTGLGKRSGLEAKLRFACESWGAEGFEMVLANPDAKDMFDIGFPPVLESYFAFEELLADILGTSVELSGLKVKAPELARVIVFGMKGFKDVAKDGKEMRRMIAALIETVTAALKSSDAQGGKR
ncbi:MULTISPECIES: TetR/AcrR family transcriptional regulator [Cupriavidus]